MKFAKLRIAFGCCALLLGASQTAVALPKQGSGAQCGCLCEAPDGAGGTIHSFSNYASHGMSCFAFAGATCNLDNPNTGGIATGILVFCNDAAKTSKVPATIFLPGGIKIGPLKKR
jgi:hypothetical protein